VNALKLPQLAWHGTKELELPIADGWEVEMGCMAGCNRAALTPEQIKAAVTKNLIGVPPIREMARGKKEVVIIFDDMTRVTRTAEIVPYVLDELAAAGIAVVVVSSELPEVLGVCDRILVMRDGSIVDETPRSLATQQSILASALPAGGQADAREAV